MKTLENGPSANSRCSCWIWVEKKNSGQLYFMNSAPQGKPTPYFYHYCFKTTIKNVLTLSGVNEIGLLLMANFCDQIYEQSGTELCFMCLTICSYVSRNSREFCLLVSFQSSFTPWNHMLATISTFLQLSLQYCCTALHLPFTLMSYVYPYYIPS